MKHKYLLLLGAVLASLFTAVNPAAAQGTVFTYQGRLNTDGNPANGLYDFRFKLYSDPLGTTNVGSSFVTNAIPTTNGLFTTSLDFGSGIFTGSNYWLEVDVRTNGPGSYTVLMPLQPVTPTPYAIFATTASNLSGTLPAGQLSGNVPSANLGGSYTSAVTFSNASGNFSGNGSGLTNVNAAALNGLTSSNFWRTAGNNGTTPGLNYLGTADNQPLEVRVANTRIMRLEPDGRGLGGGNFTGGHIYNAISQPGSGSDVIAGGGVPGSPNLILSNSSDVFIGAGAGNTVGPGVADSSILGGYGNSMSSWDAVIAGGSFNSIQSNAPYASIAGGDFNSIQVGSTSAAIGGGYSNVIQSPLSTIAGGQFNTIQPNALYSVIGGGDTNTIQAGADHSIIAGGWQNTIQYGAIESVISGGELNAILPYSQWSAIGGGEYNTNGSSYSLIAGGYDNVIQIGAEVAAIGGGSGNLIQTNAFAASIGGGAYNVIQADTIYSYSVIGGGYGNTIQSNATFAAIGGGWLNTVLTNGSFSTIGGGIGNNASGPGAFIGGGSFLYMSNSVPFFRQNTAAGLDAVVPGGAGNFAGGSFSFAAGYRAKAANDGTFTWADNSVDADFASTSSNQFLVRATGGVGINTNNPNGNALSVNGSSQLVGPLYAFGPAQVNGSLQVNGPSQLSGTLQVTDLIRSGSESGGSEAPSPAGLVVRRINSTSFGIGQLVARTDGANLLRDGTHGGFYIGIAPNSQNVTIACMGINSSGTQVNFYTTIPNSSIGQSVPIYSDAQNIVHFECTFGRTYDSGKHLTQVTLTRFGTDYYWSGNVISTYNQ